MGDTERSGMIPGMGRVVPTPDDPHGAGYGPATAGGRPIGLGTIASQTLNTFTGLAKAIAEEWLRGNPEGAAEILRRTVEQNKEMSRRGAEDFSRPPAGGMLRQYIDGTLPTKRDNLQDTPPPMIGGRG